MTRAFVCLARNDLHPNGLQLLDLWPNSSGRNLIYDPNGQTGYLSFFPANDVVAVSGAGPILAADTYYGLRSYLISNIDNQSTAAHITPSAANVTTMAASILAIVAAGTPLTVAIVDAIVATTNASSDLTGLTAAGSLSTGSLEGLFRVLSGEMYRLAKGATIAAGGGATFVGSVGDFITAPNLTPVENLGSGMGASTSYGCPLTHQVPVQTGTNDVNYRNVRQFTVTGYMNISSNSGAISKLKAVAYSWFNPAFTYGATGTATDVAGNSLATYVARGLVVYDAAGNVI